MSITLISNNNQCETCGNRVPESWHCIIRGRTITDTEVSIIKSIGCNSYHDANDINDQYDELDIFYEDTDPDIQTQYISPDCVSIVQQAKLIADTMKREERNLIWMTSEEEEKRIRQDERDQLLKSRDDLVTKKYQKFQLLMDLSELTAWIYRHQNHR